MTKFSSDLLLQGGKDNLEKPVLYINVTADLCVHVLAYVCRLVSIGRPVEGLMEWV